MPLPIVKRREEGFGYQVDDLKFHSKYDAVREITLKANCSFDQAVQYLDCELAKKEAAQDSDPEKLPKLLEVEKDMLSERPAMLQWLEEMGKTVRIAKSLRHYITRLERDRENFIYYGNHKQECVTQQPMSMRTGKEACDCEFDKQLTVRFMKTL